MSILGLDLPQDTQVRDLVTGETGTFIGWAEAGWALVWWDGDDEATREPPSQVVVAEES